MAEIPRYVIFHLPKNRLAGERRRKRPDRPILFNRFEPNVSGRESSHLGISAIFRSSAPAAFRHLLSIRVYWGRPVSSAARSACAGRLGLRTALRPCCRLYWVVSIQAMRRETLGAAGHHHTVAAASAACAAALRRAGGAALLLGGAPCGARRGRRAAAGERAQPVRGLRVHAAGDWRDWEAVALAALHASLATCGFDEDAIGRTGSSPARPRSRARTAGVPSRS